MKGSIGNIVSSFVNDDGMPLPIDNENAVFTICSRQDIKSGGHAYCYIEQMKYGHAEMKRFELMTPGHGRVQLGQSSIQNFHESDRNPEHIARELRHLATTKHHSYRISSRQAMKLEAAFLNFDAKNAKGRYVYSKPGGVLGRAIGALSGQRGVNCADLVLKMMHDAGISYVQDKLFNTPRYASGSSNR